MIHELSGIPSSNEDGALRSCTKWKAFVGRHGRDEKVKEVD